MITPAEIITIGIALLVVDIVVVALRLHVKQNIIKSVALNDYLILLSLACACGTSALIVYGAIAQGYGKVSPPAVDKGGINADQSREISATRHLTWSIVCINTWTYGLVKLSVLLFYRSIFVGVTFHIISMTLVILVCVWTVVNFLFTFLQCGGHIRAIWTDAAYVAEHCLSGLDVGSSNASLDVALDLMILILPIYWIFKLHIPLKKRLSVIGVFLFGALAIVSSIIRLIAISVVYSTHNKSANQYAYMTTLTYFGQLETGLCIIAATLPTLGPLLFPNRLPSIGSGPRVFKRRFNYRLHLRSNPMTRTTATTTPPSMAGLMSSNAPRQENFAKLQTNITTVAPQSSFEHMNEPWNDNVSPDPSIHRELTQHRSLQ